MSQTNQFYINSNPTFVQSTSPVDPRLGNSWLNTSTFILSIYDGVGNWVPTGSTGLEVYAISNDTGSTANLWKYLVFSDAYALASGLATGTGYAYPGQCALGTNFIAIHRINSASPHVIWSRTEATATTRTAVTGDQNVMQQMPPSSPLTYLAIHGNSTPRICHEYDLMTDSWSSITISGSGPNDMDSTYPNRLDGIGVSFTNGRPLGNMRSQDYDYLVHIVGRASSNSIYWIWNKLTDVWTKNTLTGLTFGDVFKGAFCGGSFTSGSILVGQTDTSVERVLYHGGIGLPATSGPLQVVPSTYVLSGIARIGVAQILCSGVSGGGSNNLAYRTNNITGTYAVSGDCPNDYFGATQCVDSVTLDWM